MKHGKQFRNMIWVGRLNGPMVCFLAIVMMLAALFDQPKEPMPLWGRILGFTLFLLIFVLAARWTRNSWKTRLQS
jgi:hypothetical protein